MPTGVLTTVGGDADCCNVSENGLGGHGREEQVSLGCTDHLPKSFGSSLHPSRAIRNPLLQLRVWIFDVIFDNFDRPFWADIA